MISDQDWEIVNAYHDGELDPDGASDFEARLRSEPELAAALEQVRGVSRSLVQLRPQIQNNVVNNRTRKAIWQWAGGGVLAASLLIASFTYLPESGTNAQDIHRIFLDQTFAVGSGNLHPVVTQRTYPDLSAANLTFVASRITDIGKAAHYAGRNGCRLTFLTLSGPTSLTPQSNMQVQQWNFGKQHFAILASGMDANKFAAIAEFLKQETKKLVQPKIETALRDATRNAKRCA